MAKVKVKIELDEKDIKELIAEKYNLKLETMYLSISHDNGNAREPAYTYVIVEGDKLS